MKFHFGCKYNSCRKTLHALGHQIHDRSFIAVGSFCRECHTSATFCRCPDQRWNSLGFGELTPFLRQLARRLRILKTESETTKTILGGVASLVLDL